MSKTHKKPANTIGLYVDLPEDLSEALREYKHVTRKTMKEIVVLALRRLIGFKEKG